MQLAVLQAITGPKPGSSINAVGGLASHYRFQPETLVGYAEGLKWWTSTITFICDPCGIWHVVLCTPVQAMPQGRREWAMTCTILVHYNKILSADHQDIWPQCHYCLQKCLLPPPTHCTRLWVCTLCFLFAHLLASFAAMIVSILCPCYCSYHFIVLFVVVSFLF